MNPGRRVGGYREYLPPPPLERVLAAVWRYDEPLARGAVHRLLPETGVSLCWSPEGNASPTGSSPQLLVIGPIRQARFFRAAPGTRMVALQLKPEWCAELLGVAPGEQVDAIIPAAELHPSLRELSQRLEDSTASSQTLALLLRWAGARISRLREGPSTRLAHAGLEELRYHMARPPHGHHAADRAGASARHLRRTIRGATGFGPKFHHRVLRLNQTVAQMDRAASLPWARLAAQHGYFDQAHLIREFHSLTGATPTRVRAERLLQNAGGSAPR